MRYGRRQETCPIKEINRNKKCSEFIVSPIYIMFIYITVTGGLLILKKRKKRIGNVRERRAKESRTSKSAKNSYRETKEKEGERREQSM